MHLLHRMQLTLPRRSLLIICKSFRKPHLDFDEVIYDQPSNALFSNKIESEQYTVTLAITGAIKAPLVMSCIKISGLSSFNKGNRWGDCVCSINVFATEQSIHIKSLLTQMRSSHRPPNTFNLFPSRTKYFKNCVFYMLLANGINLIQRFVALAIILFSVMYCWNLQGF